MKKAHYLLADIRVIVIDFVTCFLIISGSVFLSVVSILLDRRAI